MWDCDAKSIHAEFAYSAPIVAYAFDKRSGAMVVALGYDWSMGAWGMGAVREAPRVVVMQLGGKGYN